MIPNPVARLSVADRNRRLRMSLAKGDQLRRDRRNPDVWLVSSASHANVWYRVQDGRSCGCVGFQQRGICRHLVRVSWECWQLRKEALSHDPRPAA